MKQDKHKVKGCSDKTASVITSVIAFSIEAVQVVVVVTFVIMFLMWMYTTVQ